MKEAGLSHLKQLIEQSVNEYVYWCDALMGYRSRAFIGQKEWEGVSHAGHIRYTHIIT